MLFGVCKDEYEVIRKMILLLIGKINIIKIKVGIVWGEKVKGLLFVEFDDIVFLIVFEIICVVKILFLWWMFFFF